MLYLSVDVGCMESIEVVLQPFEAQFDFPIDDSTTSSSSSFSSSSSNDERSGLLRSSINIRQTRRKLFKFDQYDTTEERSRPSMENTKKEMDAIDQKIKELLKKHKKRDNDGSSLECASASITLDCETLSSISSSFNDHDWNENKDPAIMITTRPKKATKVPLGGAVSLQRLQSKAKKVLQRPDVTPMRN